MAIRETLHKLGKEEVFRAMYFQFVGHTIDQTFDAEKKMKDDLSDVPFA